MEQLNYVNLLLQDVNFMTSKYRPSISGKNVASKLRSVISIKYTLGFKDLL